MEVGCFKKQRKKVGNYKPKEQNKEKLQIFLTKLEKNGTEFSKY
jgi:hypothetical protein